MDAKFSCASCEISFYSMSHLKMHQKVHTGKKLFTCMHCGNSYVCRKSLKNHLRTHTGEKAFKCEKCGKHFACRYNHDAHQRLHTGETPFVCSECGKGFTLLHNLRKHQKKHFDKRPSTRLPHGKKISQNDHLSDVLQSVEKEVDNPELPCVIKNRSEVKVGNCSQEDNQLASRKRAEETLGSSKNAKAQHASQRGHSGKSAFCCSQCGKSFLLQSWLRAHRRIHIGEKTFKCEQCGKYFPSNRNRMIHERTHMERPFICELCGKRFTCKYNHNIHQRLHTGERPFTCTQCLKSFTLLHNLKKHQVRYHLAKETLNNPSLLGKKVPQNISNNSMLQSVEMHVDNSKPICIKEDSGNSSPPGGLVISGERSVKLTILPDAAVEQRRYRDAHSTLRENTEESSSDTPANRWSTTCDDSLSSSVNETHRMDAKFSCASFERSFSTMSHLKMHQKVHTGKTLFTCMQCGKSYICRKSLKNHLRTHTGEKAFKCEKCGKHFACRYNHDAHQRLHTGETPFVCSECGKGFTLLHNLRKHQKKHLDKRPSTRLPHGKEISQNDHLSFMLQSVEEEVDNPELSCVIKNRSEVDVENGSQEDNQLARSRKRAEATVGSSKNAKAQHASQRGHSGKNAFCCSQCGKSFLLQSWLRAHRRIHIGEKTFKCEQCGKYFSSNRNRMIHQRTHMERPFICELCGKRFTCKYNHNIHQRLHTGERPFTCTQCLKSFTLLHNLKKHQVRYHLAKETLNNPSLLGKKVPQNISDNSMLQSVEMHVDNSKPIIIKEESGNSNPPGGLVISGERSVKLTILPGAAVELRRYRDAHSTVCESTEESSSDTPANRWSTTCDDSLSSSVNETHWMDAKFSCDACERSFPTMSHLKMHQKVHTGKKLFTCMQCGNSYICRKSLKNHLRTHTGEKAFKCEKCGKHFACRYNHDAHQRLHTGETPFVCSECGKGFTLLHNLRKHQKKHLDKRPSTRLPHGKKISQNDHLSDVLQSVEKEVDNPELSFVIKTRSELDVGNCSQEDYQLARSRKRAEEILGSSQNAKAQHASQRGHSKKGAFCCSQCGKSFLLQSWLREHRRIHIGEKTFKCEQCGKYFPSNRNRMIHQRTHMERPFICELCGKRFTCKYNHNIHQRLHTGERPFTCTQCLKSFTLLHNLKKHQVRYHLAKETLNNPSLLGKKVLQNISDNSMLQSIEIHVDNSEPIFIKEDSGNSNSPGGLAISGERSVKLTILPDAAVEQRHYGDAHSTLRENTEESNWDTPANRWSTTCDDSLSSSVHETHWMDAKFSCDACERSFPTMSHLKMHQKVHTGKKLFTCMQCGNSYICRKSLKNHLRTHTGEKAFKCEKCGKHFACRYNHDAHQRLHTGETPFVCSECGKGFTLLHNLRKHQKKHLDKIPCTRLLHGKKISQNDHLSDVLQSVEKEVDNPELSFVIKSEVDVGN